MADQFSFEVVSEVNMQELKNALDQATKEIKQRFDFKDSKAEITLEKNEIKLTAPDAYKMKILVKDIVLSKLAKRGISMKSVDEGQADLSPLGHARQSVKLKEGIEAAVAKQITAFIRDGKFKVTSSINGAEVRVNSKSRDELQSVIAAVQAQDFPVALSFVNFRD